MHFEPDKPIHQQLAPTSVSDAQQPGGGVQAIVVDPLQQFLSGGSWFVEGVAHQWCSAHKMA